jgi:hypothetical protein
MKINSYKKKDIRKQNYVVIVKKAIYNLNLILK